MPIKLKVKTRTLPWAYYGQPTGEAGIASDTRQFVNHYSYHKIDYDRNNEAYMGIHRCEHVAFDRPQYGGMVRQEIVPTHPYSVVATNDHVASFVFNSGGSPVVSNKAYPNDPGFRKLKEVALCPDHMLRELSLRGCALRLPKFKNRMSLINFLIELKDLRRLAQQARDIRDYLARTKTPKWRELPNYHLATEFGYLPFIRDLLACARAIGEVRRKAKELIKNQHRVISGNYRKTLPNVLYTNEIAFGDQVFIGPDPTDGTTGPMFAFTEGGSETIAIRNRRVTFTVRYSYWIPNLTDFQVEMRGYLAALGVEWNPKILWDALPFSFLIDWAIDVGDWLERKFAQPVCPISLRIHDFCVSEKHSYSYDWRCKVPVKWNPPDPPSSVGISYSSKGKYFRRIKNAYITEAECLEMPWRGDPGAPSPRQLACFLSLVATNSRAVKPKKPPRIPYRDKHPRRWIKSYLKRTPRR
jgi:hypothetical protein